MVTSRADGKNCIEDSIWRVYDHRKMADNYNFPLNFQLYNGKREKAALKFII